MRRRRTYLLGALAVVTAGVACTLNPQPLPPIEEGAAAPGGGFATKDSGSRQDDEPGAVDDAGMGADANAPPDGELDGGADADAGDPDGGDPDGGDAESD